MVLGRDFGARMIGTTFVTKRFAHLASQIFLILVGKEIVAIDEEQETSEVILGPEWRNRISADARPS